MSIVRTSSTPLPLTLEDSKPALFMARDIEQPCTLTIPGQSNLDHRPFNVTASGSIEAFYAGTLTITLYGFTLGYPLDEFDSNDPATWVEVASSPAEAIAGALDPEESQWLIQGVRLMFSTRSGKMQGTFVSNVADNPIPEANLTHNLQGIKQDSSPAIYFAVGATFIPTGGAKDAPLANLALARFSMDD